MSSPGASVPLVTGQWVPICFIVDLDKNLQQMYYNNMFLWQGPYLPDTIEFSVQPKGGGPTTCLDDVSVLPTSWIVP